MNESRNLQYIRADGTDGLLVPLRPVEGNTARGTEVTNGNLVTVRRDEESGEWGEYNPDDEQTTLGVESPAAARERRKAEISSDAESLRKWADTIEESDGVDCVCGKPELPGIHRTDGPCYQEIGPESDQAVAVKAAPVQKPTYTVFESPRMEAITAIRMWADELQYFARRTSVELVHDNRALVADELREIADLAEREDDGKRASL